MSNGQSKDNIKKVSIEDSKEDAVEESREDAKRLERVWRTYGGHCYNLETKTRSIETLLFSFFEQFLT